MRRWFGETFRSLQFYNYRLWAGGSLVSNIGSWMQRIAQDWLVLTELTDHSASAVGVTTALQFAPQLLLLPWTGLVADRYEQRKLLLATQGVQTTAGQSLPGNSVEPHRHARGGEFGQPVGHRLSPSVTRVPQLPVVEPLSEPTLDSAARAAATTRSAVNPNCSNSTW